jgi:hypothetical protein
MKSGALHTVRFAAGFVSAGAISSPYIGRAVSPWNSLVSSEGFSVMNGLNGVAGEVIQYEAFFKPTSSTSARVSLKVASPSVPVAFDTVSVREVRGYSVATPSDWAAMPMRLQICVTYR